jgi:pimeloyl-ACP methyl ester carboxylesterase
MQTLLLLHGALGAAEQLNPLQQLLGKKYKVHTLDFAGHGKAPGTEAGFSIPFFAQNVLEYLDQHQLDRVGIFGYSMGGYVAMYLAKHYPARVDKVITLATKFHWDEAIAAQETKMLNPEQTLAKVPAFAETLKQRHGSNDWIALMNKTAAMLKEMGRANILNIEDYESITSPCLLLLGDRDKMITLDETVNVYKALSAGQMGMLPNTPHPIEKVNYDVFEKLISCFLNQTN